MATIYERDVDPRLTVFVKSKKHPLYLNGRTIYLMSSQALLGCAYLARTILLDKFSVRWKEVFSSPGLPPAERGSRRLANMLTTFASVSLFVVLCSTLHAVLFGFARSVVLPVLHLLPFVSQILRPFTAHFLRGSFTLTLLFRQWPLICRTFYLAMTTVACWETAESPLFSGINVANSAADPALALVSGITSSDGCFKHFAYAELQQLASENSPTASARRTELFSDQKYNPTMWSTLVREALLTLGKDYQLLLRRGQPEAPPAPPANPPLAVPAEVKPVPLIRTSVLKATSASPLRAALDSLASDGPISTVVGSTADAGVSHIPELFQSVLHASPGGDRAIEAVKKSEEQMVGLYEQTKVKWQGGLGGILRRNAPAQVIEVVGMVEEWWTRDRVNKAVEMALPNRHLDVLAISVLCSLICASLTEDKYGVVQRDIPRMLEALVSFLVVAEEYQADISRKYNVPSEEDMKKLPKKECAEKERLAFEVANAGEVLTEVSNVLKDGIMQVVRTFGDKLAAFKFPLRTAKKLQTFVDYA
ncbi:uncharacterized protein LAESUDRAFT_759175 [Laetiporus sulphureus 93-53]|uniref:Nucleoporin protein Ndc1-Nup n=1 Tax=Laetiporus sulphureus 93-53 TaxID=1314785 RepID=A0A165EBM3_9APHY|nr:uncharacterized protein LAESUDRAFT_759175 [Laetiporus sulphureus 93-53]KZT06677.1 hypothetical protein LAESUDRAFT_759175 [Laetiporus sulphureus 93-53]